MARTRRTIRVVERTQWSPIQPQPQPQSQSQSFRQRDPDLGLGRNRIILDANELDQSASGGGYEETEEGLNSSDWELVDRSSSRKPALCGEFEENVGYDQESEEEGDDNGDGDEEELKKENDEDYATGMELLRAWLDQEGLGKYAILFEFHDVDDEVLQLLTIEDLKDMGIKSVGSRLKIYRYIQKFRTQFS